MSALEPYSSTESGCNWKRDSLQVPLFDEMQMSNHGSFGVRRLVAAFVLAPGHSGDKSPHSMSDSLFVHLLRVSAAEIESHF